MNQEDTQTGGELQSDTVDTVDAVNLSTSELDDNANLDYFVLVANSPEELEELKEEAQLEGVLILPGVMERLPGGRRVWTQKVRRRGPQELKRARERADARVRSSAREQEYLANCNASSTDASKRARLAVGYTTIISSELIVRQAKDTSDSGDYNLAGTRHPGTVIELTLACGHVIKRNASTFRGRTGKIRCSKCAYAKLRDSAVAEGIEVGIGSIPSSVTEIYMPDTEIVKKYERAKYRQRVDSKTGTRMLDGKPVILFKDQVGMVRAGVVEIEQEIQQPDPEWYENSWD